MYLLYTLLLCCYFVAAVPVVAYAHLRRGKQLGRLGDRLGRVPEAINPRHDRSIWVHAVSVGEVMAARPLLDDLRVAYPHHRILVSTTTATGQQVATRLADVEAIDAVFYAPLDLMPFVTRTLDRVTPDLMVFVDTEIWPTWLRASRRRGVRTVVVNGRISDRSYRGYRIVRPFMRRVLQDVDRVCAQTESWGRRFVELGLPPDRVTVTGSLKFDTPDISTTAAEHHVGDRVLRHFAFTEGRPVLIAASTLSGEDEAVLRAFRTMRDRAADAVLILAPRHPERASSVLELATSLGFRTGLRSAFDTGGLVEADVVVLDTVGELARLFQLATLVFVGGSLVRAGGHNILEPAVFGKPIVFGPHMDNFGEIADQFVRRSAAVQVSSAAELERVLVELLADPVGRAGLGAAARALVEANRGARVETLDAIVELLPRDEVPGPRQQRDLQVVP